MIYNTIEGFYGDLESNIKDLQVWNDDITGLRQLINIQTDEKMKRQLILETYVFDWRLENGDCIADNLFISDNGSRHEYPSYNSFDANDYEYLLKRAAEVSNDYLIARYNQILWNSPKAHNQSTYFHARAAIDAYLRILNKSDCFSEKSLGDSCIDIFFNAFELSAKINYRINDCKTLYKKWLFKDKQLHQHIKAVLLQRLTENSRVKKRDFHDTASLLRKLAQEENDVSWRLYYYETGLKVAQKCIEETKIWNKNIGDCYVTMAENRLSDESNMVPILFLIKAASYYRAAGLTEDIEKTEHIISKLRTNIGLSEVAYTIEGITAKILFDHSNFLSQKVLEYDSNDIYIQLSKNQNLFPTKSGITQTTLSQQNDFIHQVSRIVVDINNNYPNNGSESDEDIFFRNYGFAIKFYLQAIYRIFDDGLKSGKINYNSMITFLRDETWLGQALPHKDSTGKTTQYNWLSLIAPSLHYYFMQAEIASLSPGVPVNYIIAIDSLTLKIEGLLREIAKLCKIPSLKTTRDGTREKYIEEILAESEIEEFIGEDNIIYFKFFFTKKGANIRNDVAHSFYKHHNYADGLMPILICAILKLSMFKLTTKTNVGDLETAT